MGSSKAWEQTPWPLGVKLMLCLAPSVGSKLLLSLKTSKHVATPSHATAGGKDPAGIKAIFGADSLLNTWGSSGDGTGSDSVCSWFAVKHTWMETFTQGFMLLTATAGKGRGKKKLMLFPRGNAR